jgi:hypothetical protein
MSYICVYISNAYIHLYPTICMYTYKHAYHVEAPPTHTRHALSLPLTYLYKAHSGSPGYTPASKYAQHPGENERERDRDRERERGERERRERRERERERMSVGRRSRRRR